MRSVALLRGINVGGHRKVPMAELRAAAEEAGFTRVETYIQSGNLIFDSGKLGAAEAAMRLERTIAGHFGFSVDLVVRTAREWARYAESNPFTKAAQERPNLLHLGLSTSPCAKGAAKILRERAAGGEVIEIVGDAIWIDFNLSTAKSKLSPAFLEKAIGSPVTLRNWRTVLKIREILDEK
jgi:uncharacterized protein (DUF1697 family)